MSKFKKKQETHVGREKIREAYENNGQDRVTIIPSEKELIPPGEAPKLRVCAYCRVSTGNLMQETSYELQVQNYTEKIQNNPNWIFVGVYADEGITATSMKKRDQFNLMMQDCKDGKIDLIICKACSRFARNIVDCLSCVRMLKSLRNPVGVFFENENLNTLNQGTEMQLSFAAMLAQSESENKSISIKWAFRTRCAKGVVSSSAYRVFGYDVDENKTPIVVEEEAEIVRKIYAFYIDGFSALSIADALTASGIPSPGRLSTWNPQTIYYILRNRKYTGEVILQKTFTADCLSHKVLKNTGQERRYQVRDANPPIISFEDYDLVQKLIVQRTHKRSPKYKAVQKPTVVRSGTFKGYIIVNPQWTDGDSLSF